MNDGLHGMGGREEEGFVARQGDFAVVLGEIAKQHLCLYLPPNENGHFVIRQPLLVQAADGFVEALLHALLRCMESGGLAVRWVCIFLGLLFFGLGSHGFHPHMATRALVVALGHLLGGVDALQDTIGGQCAGLHIFALALGRRREEFGGAGEEGVVEGDNLLRAAVVGIERLKLWIHVRHLLLHAI